MTADTDMPVRAHPERGRYEIEVGGALAGFLEFRGGDAMRALTHTEVLPAFEGRGVGGRLVAGALEDVRAQGLHVIPICPFVRAYLVRHPEALDLVTPRMRRSFGLPDPPGA